MLCHKSQLFETTHEIFRGAAECIGLFAVGHVQLAQSKVAQCNVPAVVQQNVFWFEISADVDSKIISRRTALQSNRAKSSANL